MYCRSCLSVACAGTDITIIGIVHASNSSVPPAIASYTIDSGDPVALPLPLSTRDIPNQQFFESPDLPLSAHVLTINITSDGSPYTLDTLIICTKATNPIAAVTSQDSKAAAKKVSRGVIGGIVGSVVAILVLVLGIIILHRRRRRARAARTSQSPIGSWLRRTCLYGQVSKFPGAEPYTI